MTAHRFRTACAALLTAAASIALSAASSPAAAQTIAAIVNGTPITSQEVSERRAFVRLTQKKDPGAKETIDNLIDEALILKEGERRKIVASDADVEDRFNEIAENVKLKPDQLGQALAQGGASARTLRQSIKSQFVYQRLIRGRFNVGNAVKESDIAAQIQQRRAKGTDKAYRYQLRQIVFVLPKQPSAGAIAQRQREAESLRARIQSCDAGVQLARGMRDVAVKEPVYRTSAQIGQAFRERLDKIKIGQATSPDRVEQGVEIVALCGKEETQDDSAIRQEIQGKLADDQFKVEAKKYLAELKRRAVIIYR